MLSRDKIRAAAFGAGFSLCGVARARVLGEHEVRLNNWLEGALGGGLAYMSRSPHRRADPSALVEGARTVVVCAVNYKNRYWNQTTTPRSASFLWAPDYHVTIKTMLYDVMAQLDGVGGRVFCDTAPILEKAWAVEAGLGRVGKNSLLVTPEYGSFVLLGLLVLDAEADEYDGPLQQSCPESCTRCIDACPSGAIVAPRVVDAGRCVARITLEKNPPPESETYGWAAGCDTCQSVCPDNFDTPLTVDPRFAPLDLPRTKVRP